jgi:hypothetical protein
MWKRDDIQDGVRYVLWLCQDVDRRRYFRPMPRGERADEGLLYTEEVSNELLRARDVIRISEVVRLATGEPFVVDAHGTWFTESELRAMRDGRPRTDVPWVGGVEPRRAPK